MKTAIYIQDGVVQLVLTPENDWERRCVKSFEGEHTEVKIFTANFCETKGGYYRQFNDETSLLIIKKDPPVPKKNEIPLAKGG